jgi:hypothetical protein
MSEETVANAPHRPPSLPMTEIGDELLSTERSRSMDTQQRPDVREPARRTGWRTAAIAFAAVILVVGAVAGIAAMVGDDGDDVVVGGDEEPTLTFDGTTVTYSGPETLEAGAVTFTLNNTSEEDIYFAWGLINDDSFTLEDELAWIAANPDTRSTPPWLIAWTEIGQVDPGETVERTTSLIKGKNDLVALPPIHRDLRGDMESRNGATYVAAIIEVTGD